MEEVKSSQVSSEPSGKKSSNKMIIIVVVVVLVLAVGGFFLNNFIAKKIGEKATEGILSSLSGGKVDVDTKNDSVKFNDGNNSIEVGTSTWPTDMPAPKYSSGKITASTTLGSGSSRGWSVTISETNKDQYDAYKKDVESAGWKSENTTEFGVTISQFTKDNYTMSATYDPSSSGVSITISANE